MLSEAELKKLRWLCSARSMREMDVLLGNFFETRFAFLNEEQAVAFAELAGRHDLELWPLITGQRECTNPVQAEVIAMLKNARLDLS